MPSIRPKDGQPTANEFGQLRSWLARQGVTQARITEAIGDDHTQTRAQIVQKLTVFCQQLPKG